MSERILLDDSGDALLLGDGDYLLLEDEQQPVTEPVFVNPLVEYAGQHWTDFREYVRGRKPPDWTERGGESSIYVEGNGIDGAHKSVLYLRGNSSSRILTWNAPDYDGNRNHQESRCIFRVINAGVSTAISLLVLRCSADGTSYYRIRLMWVAQAIEISKVVNGTSTVIHTYPKNLKQGCYYVARFRAETDDGTNATNLSCTVFPYVIDQEEIITWDTTVSDNTPDLWDGHIGVRVVSTDEVEISQFSVGTNRLPAPQAETMHPYERAAMESWLGEPGIVYEMTARVQWYNPATDAIEHAWFTTSHRTTASNDYPANTQFKSLLHFKSSIFRALQGARLLGRHKVNLPFTLTFDNTPAEGDAPGGPLADWSQYKFAQQPVEVRLGMRYLVEPSPEVPNPVIMLHRRFEPIVCLLIVDEPEIEGGTATIKGIADAVSLNLLVNQVMRGISTGFKSLTSSGWLSIPANAAYARTSYRISLRVYIPAGGFPGTGLAELSKLEDGAGRLAWYIAVYQASHPTTPNQLRFAAHDAAGTLIIAFTIPLSDPHLDRWLSLVFAVKGSEYWYALANEGLIGSGELTSNPISLGTFPVQCMRSAVGGILVDHRIEHYLDADEARPRTNTRAEPDLYTISMHRCDDTSGATVTDYAPLANHGTLQGADGVDRSRVRTYLGSADKAGERYTNSQGVIYHAPAQAIDPIHNIYRYSQYPRSAGTTLVVRQRGVVVTSYTEPANEGKGTIDFTGAVSEPVTVSIIPTVGQPENPAIHAPMVALDMLSNGGMGSPYHLDKASFAALRSILPVKAGMFTPASTSVGGGVLDVLINQCGGFYDEDGHGRITVGALLPPINPGPYGQESLLEFTGIPNGGVTVAPDSSYHLKQSTNYSIDAWVKFHRPPVDPSTSSTFTYFPNGYTIVDQCGLTATGFYLGIDGRDGNVIFGQPGVLGSTTGLHYIKMQYPFRAGVWYLISAIATETGGVGGERGIFIGTGLEAEQSVAEITTGAVMAPPEGVPLRIGHGPRGSFVGSINTVIGASPLRTITQRQAMRTVRPAVTITPLTGDTHRFYLSLTDGGQYGVTSRVLEAVRNIKGYMWGARWCPRFTMDLRGYDWTSNKTGTASLDHVNILYRRTYRINHAPLGPNDFAVSLTAEERLPLQQPFLTARTMGGHTRFASAKEVPISETPLYSHADVLAVTAIGNSISSQQYGSSFSHLKIRNTLTGAAFNGIPLPDVGAELARLRAGDETLIFTDFKGTESGIPARITKVEIDLDKPDEGSNIEFILY